MASKDTMNLRLIFGALVLTSLAFVAILVYVLTGEFLTEDYELENFDRRHYAKYKPIHSTNESFMKGNSQPTDNQTSLFHVASQRPMIIHNMDAWRQTSDNITCGEYQCIIGNSKTSMDIADLLIFSEKTVRSNKPPTRDQSVLWAFISMEPQSHLGMSQLNHWDSLFNYSATFIRSSDGVMSIWRKKLVKKSVHTNWSFAKKAGKAAALWFVSHCQNQKGRLPILSGRAEYAIELSKYFSVDAYTGRDECRQQLGDLMKSKPDDNNKQPSISQYAFYLSFESALCRDYISEKLWKIIEGNISTIPIVLGGLSMEEYELVAPPNSFIHVKNFTSPQALANHLKFLMSNETAFNYYHQWRNEYQLQKDIHPRPPYLCYLCQQAHKRPHRVWKTFSKDFGPQNCLDVSTPDVYCPYYNLSRN